MHSDLYYKRIFLLSHMRASTSLLGHILGSHPAINGYFEMHIPYDAPSALERQRRQLLEYESLKPDSHYLFDKLLHNDYGLQPEVLGMDGLKVLVCVREPQQTIRSIVNLFAQKGAEERYAIPGEAARYFVERLQWIADFCCSSNREYYYFDSSLLQQKPQTLLPAMTEWLGLDSPLSDRYQLFSQTGTARKGDSSRRIWRGVIDKAETDYSHIPVAENVLDKAQRVYRECRRKIIQHAADSVIL